MENTTLADLLFTIAARNWDVEVIFPSRFDSLEPGETLQSRAQGSKIAPPAGFEGAGGTSAAPRGVGMTASGLPIA